MLTRRNLLAAAVGAAAGSASWTMVRAGTGQRVLVLGGDLAEIVFAIGAGEIVIATDTTALWPPEVEKLPKVGYLRRLSAEGLLSLMPDLVLAGADAGPQGALDQVRAAGIRVETGPEGTGFDTVSKKIVFVGSVLKRDAEAEALAARVAMEMASVEVALSSLAETPSVLFLISLANGAPMASGTGTAADEMIRLAHARNVVDGFEGYRPLSPEAAVGLAPQIIVLPDHAVGAGDVRSALDGTGLAATPAAGQGRVVVMDGLKLLGFGPRTPAAVGELARALHPAAAARLDL